MTTILVFLTVIATVASTVAVWVRATLLDTDRFMAVVEPALTDPAFPATVSEVVTEQVLAALDLETRVTATLEEFDDHLAGSILVAADLGPAAADRLARLEGPRLVTLSPGIATALESRVAEVVEASVTSEVVTAQLPELVRQAHAGGVALVRGELARLPSVDVRDGEVRIDLVPVIAQALQEVVTALRSFLPDITLPETHEPGARISVEELSAALRTRLPSDLGQVTVLRDGALPDAQRALRTLDRLVGALVVLTVALLAVTLLTTRRRRRTAAQLAAGLALALGASMLLVRRIEGLVLESISPPNANRVAAALLEQLAHSLRSTALLVLLTAIITATVGYLLGRPPRPTLTSEPGAGGAPEDRTRDPRRRPAAAVTASRNGSDAP